MSAAVIVAVQKKYISRFTEANAIDASNAKSLTELDLRDRFIFRMMVKRGVFINAGNDKFYLDKQGLENFEARRIKIVFSVVFILAIIILLINFLNK